MPQRCQHCLTSLLVEPLRKYNGGTVELPRPICPFICPSRAISHMLLTGFWSNFRELCVSLSPSSNFKTMTGPWGVWQLLCSCLWVMYNISEALTRLTWNYRGNGVFLLCFDILLNGPLWDWIIWQWVSWYVCCCLDNESFFFLSHEMLMIKWEQTHLSW